MNYIKSNSSWTVVIDSKVYTFDGSHEKYDALVESIKVDDTDTFLDNFSIGPTIESWAYGKLRMVEGILYYGDEQVHPTICELIKEMIEGGFNEKPILNFLLNLYKNPSNHAINGLYEWIKHRDLAITEAGHFLAYKYVSVASEPYTDRLNRAVSPGDYVDSHSHTYRNNVGDVNFMPRRMVNDDRDSNCGSGFHVGAMSYVGGHDHIIICKINPRDVVEVPKDTDCQKLRCCLYEVVSKFTEKFSLVSL